MKRILAVGLGALVLGACSVFGGKDLETEERVFKDSTPHASLSIQVELPKPRQGAAAKRIRTLLVDVMDEQLSHIGLYGDEERHFPPFRGDVDKTVDLMEYYSSRAMEVFSRSSQEDYDEAVKSMEDDDLFSEDERAEFLSDMPAWDYEFSLLKTRETDRYVVFLSEDYVYMGGAHGGVLGYGGLTFDKKDGHRVEEFLVPGCQDAIQPLLRKGFVKYYADDGVEISEDELDDYLFLEDDTIPLPGWTPYPDKDGLVFTYQQYEIAAYAAGMPSITIPFSDLLPYMTPEAKDLLGLD